MYPVERNYVSICNLVHEIGEIADTHFANLTDSDLSELASLIAAESSAVAPTPISIKIAALLVEQEQSLRLHQKWPAPISIGQSRHRPISSNDNRF